MNTRSLAMLTLLACAGAAVAQPPIPPPPERDRGRQQDPLRGPEVRDRQVPGVNGSFGEPGGDMKRFVNENRLPPRVFRDAMKPIMSPDAPENLRLGDEQRTRYQEWMDDFQKTIGEYMKEHRGELGELRRKVGENGPRRPNAGGPGGPGERARPGPNPDEMRAPTDEKEVVSARERLRFLMAGAPKIEDLYTRIWTELRPDQQRAVDGKIAEFRAEQAKMREENYVKRMSKKKELAGERGRPGQPQQFGPQNGPPGTGARGDFADRGNGVDPQRRERLMRLFSRLTPEQQEQLLGRLERARDENGGEPPPPAVPARQERGVGSRGGAPVPQPDDSMMPPNPAGGPVPAGEPPPRP